MQSVASAVIMVFSVLFPAKAWFPPAQPWTINVKPSGDVTLMLTDFAGKGIEPKGSADVGAEKSIDLKQIFPDVATPGTYILYAVPKGKMISDFVGTPLVIESREDHRPGAPPGLLVAKIEPLRYVVMDTEKGKITIVFYYDVAPNTATNFLTLAEGGYFDGLTFHRIVPGFVLQSGDPKGDSTGGPGYMIDAEFNDRPHVEGVLSMARSGDPNEAPGNMPRSEFANSAGSQFFICLNYENTKQLDGRYTAFGRVVEGMEIAKTIGQTPIADERSGRPVKAPVINKVEVKSVTPGNNPYANLKPSDPATK